ncbi:DUF5996 family protein [Actinomadura sp. HBU206391]|uniref:DUF5996 family protein n=1 Tax=Actinomadura sp. HBU206391 TaxID=2731692 RepID=UPI00164F02C2|nr:DUF5996 family protein [Actinomadura sp. HBU206391]MBC6458929.1 hypothetical protein [Actinomadura sp. HBU206391]
MHGDQAGVAEVLPPLPLAAWWPTKVTLHLYCQIMGQIRLAATAPHDHWSNVPLFLTIRGLTTRRMRYGGLGFAIDFDFLDHRLVVRTDAGSTESLALHDGLSVKDFHEALLGLLDRSGVHLTIGGKPLEVPVTTPFAEDTGHSSYDEALVGRFWRVLSWTDAVFEEFEAWFSGKTSPARLFWHSMDLAITRYSGRHAPQRSRTDPVTVESFTHEMIGFGLSPGDDRKPEASFYSCTQPEPPDLTLQPLCPQQARWIPFCDGTHRAILAWEDVRTSADPRRTLLTFLQSAYEAGGITAGWQMADFESTYFPAHARNPRCP